MGTREVLEDRIRANPSDWSGWRIYGDFLLEQGDARGELIQLEHRLATEELSARARKAIKARVEAVVAEHRPEWLRGIAVPEGARLEWRFGFVVGVELRWRQNASTLETIERMTAHPTFRYLSALDLHGNRLGPEGAQALAQSLEARSEGLRSLVTLNLAHAAIGDPGVEALAGTRALRSLTSLDLSFDEIGPEGAVALAGSETLRSLTTLDLSHNRIGARGAEALAGPGSLRSLCALNLERNGIEPEGALALASSSALRSLTALSLGWNRLGDEGAIALARSGELRSLTRLGLERNGIGDPGATALARSEAMRSLCALNMQNNALGAEGQAALAVSEALRGCRVLT